MVERLDSDPENAQDISPQVWYLTYVNPYDVLYFTFSCEGDAWTNFSRYCNEEFDALINEGFEVSATDREQATEKFIEAQEFIVEDSPAVLTANVPSIWVYNADIDGFVDNPAYPNVVFFHDLTTAR
jgi:peptide/nickel transport system substrate-binding protein